MKDALQTIAYGKVVASNLPMGEADERVKSLLKDEGFGVLCDIDVQKTLAEKLGEEFRPYRILGACNPILAHQALSNDSQLGLLLPCNLSATNNPALAPIAREVNQRLARVLDRIAE